MITYSNFKMLKELKNGFSMGYIAEIDIKTKHWFRKPEKETRRVSKAPGELFWAFVDTGKWTKGLKVEKLFRAYEFQQLLEQD